MLDQYSTIEQKSLSETVIKIMKLPVITPSGINIEMRIITRFEPIAELFWKVDTNDVQMYSYDEYDGEHDMEYDEDLN